MISVPSTVLCLFCISLLAVGGSSAKTSNLRQRPTDNSNHSRDLQATATAPSDPSPQDLRIRFNKFAYDQDQATVNYGRLTSIDYPLRGVVATMLKNQTNAVSVISEGDPALMPNHRALVLRYIEAIGGLPSQPDSNSGSEFWYEFSKVMQMQLGRRYDMNPATILRAPDLWASRTSIAVVAETVHDEYPGSLQVEAIQWLWSQGAPLDYDIIPFRSNSDFVGLQVALAELNTWAIAEVSPMNFYIKWYAGRPRPEEIAWMITTGELTEEDGVPRSVAEMIKSMNLKSAEEFTAYPEGAPRHPAWPAMHSAASSASFWLAVILDLTDEQYCELLRVDYAVAFARSCAGVHYPSDNTAGLNLGQTLMAEKLPDHLAERYGADPDKVRAKIDSLRFDWRNFNSFDCTTSGSTG